MGYYIRLAKSTAIIPAANLDRAYQKMCALNVTHHDQKRGGSYADGKQTAKWFSWMDENYPDICVDAQAVLETLGFHTEYNDRGDLLLTGYDSKMGQEDLFLKAIENECVGEMQWVGEDGDIWMTEFAGDTVIDGQATRIMGFLE